MNRNFNMSILDFSTGDEVVEKNNKYGEILIVVGIDIQKNIVRCMEERTSYVFEIPVESIEHV